MAEETPGNLNQAGIWMAGRAAGNTNLDGAVDRLTKEVNKFADAVGKLTASVGKARSVLGSGGPGATQQSYAATGNGGGVTFSGMPAGTSNYGQTSSGILAPRGAIPATPMAGGGAPAAPAQNGGGWSFGRMGAAATVGALGIYTSGHFEQQAIESTIAARGTPGRGVDAARQGLYNNASAQSDADAYQMYGFQSMRSGYQVGSFGWNEQKSMITGFASLNPTFSQSQIAQASYTLGTAGSFNTLQKMGINPLNKQGHADPRTVARQIVQRIGGSRVKTIEQVHAAFGPTGGATVTIDAYVAAGMLDIGTAEMVRSEMFNILLAQVQGMSFSEYNNLAGQTGGTDSAGRAARERLGAMGFQTDTAIALERNKQGQKRDMNEHTLDGFVSGLDIATDALSDFRDMLNSLMQLPGVGTTTGFVSAVTGEIPVLSSILNKFGIGAGGSAPTMSRVGAAWGVGGSGPGRQSRGGGGGGAGGGGGSGSAGLSLQAPRPGIDAMSSEQDYGTRTIGQGWHTGVDLDGTVGDPVKAAADGVVVAAGWGASGDSGYGNVVVIDHGGGWKTMYAHLASITKGKGKKVRAGEVIATVGDTGSYSRGSHLHFEVWQNGKPVNPEPFLRGRKFTGADGGGSGSGTTGQGSQGSSIGSTGSYSNAITGGVTASGGLGLGYSEVAALGLGSGGLGAISGGAGLPSGPGGVSGPGGTRGGGSVGNVGTQGGPGNVSIGSLNMLYQNNNAQWAEDLNIARDRAGVLGLQEARQRRDFLRRNFKGADWGWYGSEGGGDTGVAWDAQRFRALQKDTLNITDSLRNVGSRLKSSSAYVLLQDKETGTKFWVVSSHTQAHARAGDGSRQGAIQGQQFRELAGLYKRLRDTGLPVFSVGDFNNGRPGAAAPGSRNVGHGLDHILYGGAKATGSGRLAGVGFDGPNNPGAVMNTDHPFIWGNFAIPGMGAAGGSGGTPAQNMALGRAMAARMGWGGSQWNALKQLWMHESGWRTDADNHTSSAYGIPQALTELHGLGSKYMNDPKAQIRWGLNYIKGRYGDPSSAWNFWQKNNWYDSGAWNLSQDHDARVHKGEMILPSKIADVVRDELTSPGIRDALGRGKGGQVVFQSGAIQINFPHSNMSKREAQQAGEWVVDAMMEDRRMRALAEG